MLNLDAVVPGLPIDTLYDELVALGRGRTTAEAHSALSALVLVLANQIVDLGTVREAIRFVDDALPREAGASVAVAGDDQ